MSEKKSLMIVEDDPEMAKMLDITMSRFFEIVKTCTSKATAIDEAEAWLEENPDPDAIIIDLIINGTGGIDLYQWLRKKGISSKVVFLTGCHPESPEYHEAVETGEDLYEKDIFSSKQIARDIINADDHSPRNN